MFIFYKILKYLKNQQFDDFMELSTVPIEVKSGKDYTMHSALLEFLGKILNLDIVIV
jgi:hypothetical protein